MMIRWKTVVIINTLSCYWNTGHFPSDHNLPALEHFECRSGGFFFISLLQEPCIEEPPGFRDRLQM